MAYSELIKNFERIRDYMREFYVYGFKSRDEFTKKSARSYDDERRRVESWLGDYMRFRQTADGKKVFLSIDSRISHHNPFYKAWKAKSFTDGDITLHFLIFDVLSGPDIALPLSGITLYSGLYVNELISRVLEHETRFSELFFDYLHCIQALAGASGSPEPALRRFELALLGHLGYGVDFLHCAGSGEPVDDTMTYRYREEKGFIASLVIDNNTFTGHHLKALASREFPDVDTLRAAKRFTRIALKPYLGGKPLKSRELFRQFMPARKARADNTNND